MIPESFKLYVAEVVAKHFADAPKPDGTVETNRRHIEIKEAACKQMYNHINKLAKDKDERHELSQYAENEAQSGIYSLFTHPVRKPKRYK